MTVIPPIPSCATGRAAALMEVKRVDSPPPAIQVLLAANCRAQGSQKSTIKQWAAFLGVSVVDRVVVGMALNKRQLGQVIP